MPWSSLVPEADPFSQFSEIGLDWRGFHAICVDFTPPSPLIRSKILGFLAKSALAPAMLLHFPERLCSYVEREENKMRTLLRNLSTGLYFQGPDQWTRNPANAHNFKMIDHALEFVRHWQLLDVELAFAF